MKHSVKTIVSILSLFMILFSCKVDTSKKMPPENEDKIDKILIQFFPAFHARSLMLLDFSKKQQTFHRIGTKMFYMTTGPEEISEIYAPKSMNFQIDSLSYSYLRDISFNKEDFADYEEKEIYTDGINYSILYIFESGKIEDVDLRIFLTENQYQLIVKLIDLNIAQSTDSITTEYLKDLKNYLPLSIKKSL